MKIRRDFVTNSSSSSFILGFKSENDIQETLAQEERIYLKSVKNTPTSALQVVG